MKLFLAFLFALSLVGQTPAVLSGPIDLTPQPSDPPACYQLGSRYYNTTSNVTRVCTATGTPGSWANIGGTSSGSSAFIDWQKQTSSIPLTALTDTTVFSTSIPGGTIAAGHCLVIDGSFTYTNVDSIGAAVKIEFGSSSFTLSSNIFSTITHDWVSFRICNNTGSTSAQQLNTPYYLSATGVGTNATTVVPPAIVTAWTVNTASTQTLKMTLTASSGSSGDSVVGNYWVVSYF
jgi:hypothetical protein